MSQSIRRCMAGAILIIAASVVICGCLNQVEDTDVSELNGFDYTQDEKWPTVGDYGDGPLLALEAFPDEIIVAADGDLQQFLATGGDTPYRWSVSDVSLGSIIESNGRWCVYRRNAAGDNVVILRDRDGTEVYARVIQP